VFENGYQLIAKKPAIEATYVTIANAMKDS